MKAGDTPVLSLLKKPQRCGRCRQRCALRPHSSVTCQFNCSIVFRKRQVGHHIKRRRFRPRRAVANSVNDPLALKAHAINSTPKALTSSTKPNSRSAVSDGFVLMVPDGVQTGDHAAGNSCLRLAVKPQSYLRLIGNPGRERSGDRDRTSHCGTGDFTSTLRTDIGLGATEQNFSIIVCRMRP